MTRVERAAARYIEAFRRKNLAKGRKIPRAQARLELAMDDLMRAEAAAEKRRKK